MAKLDELKIQLKENLISKEKLERSFYDIEREDILQAKKDAKQYEITVEQEVVETKLDIVRAELKNALWAEMFPIKIPKTPDVKKAPKSKEDK